MADYVKYGLIVLVLSAVYMAGYYRAETKGELAIESLKREHAQAIVDAQEEEKAKYEKDIERLINDLNGLRSAHDQRVLELERFRNSGRDLEACISQRNDLAALAVRGEELLERALSYLAVNH